MAIVGDGVDAIPSKRKKGAMKGKEEKKKKKRKKRGVKTSQGQEGDQLEHHYETWSPTTDGRTDGSIGRSTFRQQMNDQTRIGPDRR